MRVCLIVVFSLLQTLIDIYGEPGNIITSWPLQCCHPGCVQGPVSRGWDGGDVRSESYFSVMWCANPVCTRANIPPSYSIILRTPCERHRGYTTFPHIPRKNVWNLNLSVYNLSIKYIMPCFQSIWKLKPFKIRQIVKSNSIQNFAFFPGKRI